LSKLNKKSVLIVSGTKGFDSNCGAPDEHLDIPRAIKVLDTMLDIVLALSYE